MRNFSCKKNSFYTSRHYLLNSHTSPYVYFTICSVTITLGYLYSHLRLQCSSWTFLNWILQWHFSFFPFNFCICTWDLGSISINPWKTQKATCKTWTSYVKRIGKVSCLESKTPLFSRHIVNYRAWIQPEKLCDFQETRRERTTKQFKN